MKKILLIILLVLLLIFATSCQKDLPATEELPIMGGDIETSTPEVPSDPTTEPDKTIVRIGGMTGPTSMGMVKMLDDSSQAKTYNNYDFTLAGGADGLIPLLAKGELDIASLPANLAAVLYNNTNGSIQVLGVNTLGVLYILDTAEDIASIDDLRGQTIYASGKGATPEYALRHILAENGLDPDVDVKLEWKSEPTEVVAQLNISGGIAMLPQPYVVVAQNNVENLRVALDLTEEWYKLDGNGTLLTSVIVARTDFINSNTEEIKNFLSEYAESVLYVNQNSTEAAILMEKYDIVKAAIAEKAISQCNLTLITGENMKNALSGYLEVLYEQNSASIAEVMPGDDFYYQP